MAIEVGSLVGWSAGTTGARAGGWPPVRVGEKRWRTAGSLAVPRDAGVRRHRIGDGEQGRHPLLSGRTCQPGLRAAPTHLTRESDQTYTARTVHGGVSHRRNGMFRRRLRVGKGVLWAMVQT